MPDVLFAHRHCGAERSAEKKTDTRLGTGLAKEEQTFGNL
jgi:hypothetical protein